MPRRWSALERAVELAPDLAEAWRELSLLHAARGDTVACDAAYARFSRLAPEGARLGEARSRPRQQRSRRRRGAAAARARALAAGRRRAAPACARSRPRAKTTARPSGCSKSACAWRPATAARASSWSRSCTLQMRGRADAAAARAAAGDRARQSALPHPAGGRPTACSGAAERAARNSRRRWCGEFPGNEVVWLNYGHTLRTAGRRREAIVAYRRCIALKPGFGDAWVALANLKTFRFTAADVEAMQQQLAREDCPTTSVRSSSSPSARRSRMRATSPPPSSTTRAAMRCGGRVVHYQGRERHAPRRAHPGALHARVLRRARRLGLSVAGPHFHRRPAARRLDAARADPRQSLAGRGHARADRRLAVCRASSATARRNRASRPTTRTRSRG